VVPVANGTLHEALLNEAPPATSTTALEFLFKTTQLFINQNNLII
jgi:hypothetical protein